MVDVRFYKGCDGAVLRWWRVSGARYLTVSMVDQNKKADSTYPMGIDNYNLTSSSSSGIALGTRNATEGMSYRRTHMCMQALDRSTMLRKLGPSFRGAARIKSMRQ